MVLFGKLEAFFGLQLTTREANKIADGLAKWVYSTAEMVECQQMEELPRFIQKLFFIDRV